MEVWREKKGYNRFGEKKMINYLCSKPVLEEEFINAVKLQRFKKKIRKRKEQIVIAVIAILFVLVIDVKLEQRDRTQVIDAAKNHIINEAD